MKKLLNHLHLRSWPPYGGAFYREFATNGFPHVALSGNNTHLSRQILLAALFSKEFDWARKELPAVSTGCTITGLCVTAVMLCSRARRRYLDFRFATWMDVAISGVAGLGFLLCLDAGLLYCFPLLEKRRTFGQCAIISLKTKKPALFSSKNVVSFISLSSERRKITKGTP